ncbi:MAG TPA: hypothetical protein VN154_09435 [Rhizomicrobium sp.]|nr:hypothetical protein [Rhizomicrobium sp.]
MSDEIARLEKLAETACTKLFDAPRHLAKDCYEDANRYLAEAIKIAEREGFIDIARRLKARKEQIHDVYNQQYR